MNILCNFKLICTIIPTGHIAIILKRSLFQSNIKHGIKWWNIHHINWQTKHNGFWTIWEASVGKRVPCKYERRELLLALDQMRWRKWIHTHTWTHHSVSIYYTLHSFHLIFMTRWVIWLNFRGWVSNLNSRQYYYNLMVFFFWMLLTQRLVWKEFYALSQ